MDQNTTISQENTSFSTFLLIAGAIVALGAVAGLGWWFWSQHRKIRDLEDEAAKLRCQIKNPKFSDMEKGVLWQIYASGIAQGKSIGDLGREVETQLAALRNADKKEEETPAAPAQVPTQQTAPAPVPAPQAPAPTPAPAPAPQHQPAPEEQAPTTEANKEAAAANQSWTAQS